MIFLQGEEATVQEKAGGKVVSILPYFFSQEHMLLKAGGISVVLQGVCSSNVYTSSLKGPLEASGNWISVCQSLCLSVISSHIHVYKMQYFKFE